MTVRIKHGSEVNARRVRVIEASTSDTDTFTLDAPSWIREVKVARQDSFAIIVDGHAMKWKGVVFHKGQVISLARYTSVLLEDASTEEVYEAENRRS